MKLPDILSLIKISFLRMNEGLCRGAMAGAVPGVEILCNPVTTMMMVTLMMMMTMMDGDKTRMTEEKVKPMRNQAPTIKFSSRNSSTIWDFTVKSLKMLKGVTLLGVEHLQHFAIADVALVSKEGDFKYESKGQECLLKEEEAEEADSEEKRGASGAESTTPPPPTIYKYSFKLKFHTKIFGTFKQTLVLDFGVRPLLSKVGNISENLNHNIRHFLTLAPLRPSSLMWLLALPSRTCSRSGSRSSRSATLGTQPTLKL